MSVKRLTRSRGWRPAGHGVRRAVEGINLLSLGAARRHPGRYRVTLKAQRDGGVGSNTVRMRFTVTGREGTRLLRLAS